MANNLPPWHMWGNSQVVHVEYGPGVNAKSSTQQLVRIAYGRPETWTFYFSAKLVNVITTPGTSSALDLSFNLTAGIGRSQVTIKGFEKYHFTVVGRTNIGDQRYSTSVIAPDRDGVSPATNVLTNLISDIPAQDIQLSVDIVLTTTVSQGCDVEVDAYFAPKTHIRPEWFEGIGQFRGREDAGS
jgi:hypothetical protein